MFSNSITAISTNLNFQALRLDLGTRAVVEGLPGATTSDPNASFGGLISHILNIVLVIGVVALLFFLILGGIEWMTAGGDTSKTQKAREKITNAVVGLIILVSVVAILAFVQQLIGICVINFSNSCAGVVVPPPTAP